MSNKSEFGTGLAVCLAKFSEHFSNDQIMRIYNNAYLLKKSKKDQDSILSGSPPPGLDYGKDMTNEFIFFMKKTVLIYKGSIERAMSSAITLWANGASDHLYDIETPPSNKWGEVRGIVEILKEKGLDMGHGSGLMGRKIYTVEDLGELIKLTKKALLLIDKAIGLKPDWGKW